MIGKGRFVRSPVDIEHDQGFVGNGGPFFVGHFGVTQTSGVVGISSRSFQFGSHISETADPQWRLFPALGRFSMSRIDLRQISNST